MANRGICTKSCLVVDDRKRERGILSWEREKKKKRGTGGISSLFRSGRSPRGRVQKSLGEFRREWGLSKRVPESHSAAVTCPVGTSEEPVFGRG